MPLVPPLSLRQHMTTPRRQQGFTLVELMVGVLLGMLTVLVIAQVLSQSESRRRNVAMGGDATINGSLSLFTLQRDIQVAGYGLAANPSALGCSVRSQYDTTPSTFPLVPVLITSGASGAPDTITVLQGQTQSSSVPMRVTSDQVGRFQVETTTGVHAGDQVVAVPASWSPSDASQWCTLYKVTNNTASADTTLSNDTLPHANTDLWNKTAIAPATGYPSGSFLLNLGTPVLRTYSISSTYNLQVTERSSSTGGATTQDLYPQIVNLQALYGKDTDGNGSVDVYETKTPTTSAEWQTVVSIRVALVARSNQYEKELVTTSEPKWNVGKATTVSDDAEEECESSSQCITLKISNLPDWQHYRYKVYSTTIPLRNVLWNS